MSPGVSVVGIFPTSMISHPDSLGILTCFLTSSGVIVDPWGTTIGVTVGVAITGTCTLIVLPFGNLTVTVADGLTPAGNVSGSSGSPTISHPVTPGISMCFSTSFLVNLVLSGTIIGVTFGSTTLTTTGTRTISLPSLSLTITTASFLPGLEVSTGVSYSNVAPSG